LALLIVLVAALLFATVTYDRDHPTSRLGGDYPAFYAAGSIARSGDWDELYSAERQAEEQAGLISDDGSYLYFSYPPYVAGAYAPLAGLEYRWSFLVHTVLMGLALWGAIKLLWPWLERFSWPPLAIYVLALAFYPLLRAVPGGQNTSLSLLLLAAAARLDRDERPLLAGLALAALFFKPQFGVVIVPLLLVSRRWRVLGGWVIGAITLWAGARFLTEGAWVAEWWEQAGAFRDENVAANGPNFVSLPGFLENLIGVGEPAAFVLGYGVTAVFGLAVAYFWWKHPRSHQLERHALAGAAVVVAAPQTLYYDAGIMLLGLVVAIALVPKHRAAALVVLGVLSWSHLAAAELGWSPLAPVVWIGAAALFWLLARPVDSKATPV
jgi:hypothetical protein